MKLALRPRNGFSVYRLERATPAWIRVKFRTDSHYLDDKGRIVGIDIQHASQTLDLPTLETESPSPARLKLT